MPYTTQKMTQSETADSLYDLYENCDPALLKRTREAVGMDEGVLARMACLSTAQVRQLETGGGSLFYSITIKRQAYKRVMMVLGADPPTHAPVVSAEQGQASAELANASSKDTIENIVALSSKSEYLERKPIKDFFLDMRFRMVAHKQFLSALLFLLVALSLLTLNWYSTSNSPQPPAQEEAKQATPAPTATAVSPAIAPTPPTPPTSAAAPAVAPAPASTSTAAPAVAPAPAPLVVASAPAKSLGVAAGACTFAAGPLAQVVSASANRPPNYVYVVSPVPTAVCVVDGGKKATLLELRPNEGRSVYGSPPWQVSGNSLKEVQIFFQGVRVKGPEGSEQHFTLLEKPNSP